jgi:hypothetical protein
LPTLWVDYDATTQHFTDAAKAKLTGIIAQHYKRATADDAQANPPGDPEPGGDGAVSQAEVSTDSLPHKPPNQPSTSSEAVRSALAMAALNAKGMVVFGKDWESAKNWLTERYTNKLTPEHLRHSLGNLSSDELEALTAGLAANSHYYVREWHKHRKAAANNQQAV